LSFEPVLEQNARRVVCSLPGSAYDENSAIAGEFAQARAKLAQRNVDRTRQTLHDQLHRLAHVEQEPALGLVPMAKGHVTAKNVRGGCKQLDLRQCGVERGVAE